MGEINHHCREETRLGSANQKSYDVEVAGSMDKRHQGSERSPGDHDACDPAAHAPTLCNQGPRNFQQKVAEKENASPEAKGAIVQAKVTRHLQRRRAHIHAVQERDDIEKEEKRQKTP